MKRLVIAAVLAFGICASLPAQTSLLMFSPSAQPSTSSNSASFNFALVPELAPPPASPAGFGFSGFSPKPALPNAPAPPQASSSEIAYRWDLAIGYAFVHFDSAPLRADLYAIHTDV